MSGGKSETAMDKALRGLPDHVRADVMRFAAEHGITPDDRDWVLLGIVGYHRSLAERIPADIKKQTDQSVEVIRTALAQHRKTVNDQAAAAKAQLELAEKEFQADLSKRAEAIINAIGRTIVWKQLAMAVAVSLSVVGAGGYGLLNYGASSTRTEMQAQVDKYMHMYDNLANTWQNHVDAAANEQAKKEAEFLAWLRTINRNIDDSKWRERIKFATKNYYIVDKLLENNDLVQLLTSPKFNALMAIHDEADGWSKARKNETPWPCIEWYKTRDLLWNGRDAAVCLVGFRNKTH